MENIIYEVTSDAVYFGNKITGQMYSASLKGVFDNCKLWKSSDMANLLLDAKHGTNSIEFRRFDIGDFIYVEIVSSNRYMTDVVKLHFKTEEHIPYLYAYTYDKEGKAAMYYFIGGKKPNRETLIILHYCEKKYTAVVQNEKKRILSPRLIKKLMRDKQDKHCDDINDFNIYMYPTLLTIEWDYLYCYELLEIHFTEL